MTSFTRHARQGVLKESSPLLTGDMVYTLMERRGPQGESAQASSSQHSGDAMAGGGMGEDGESAVASTEDDKMQEWAIHEVRALTSSLWRCKILSAQRQS